MILILCAPSGSGKSTMVKHLLSTQPDRYALSVSCTTRAPRGTEQDGREYYFISQTEFEQRIANGEFIEYEQVYEGLYYGTLKQEIERIRCQGRIAVFDIDVKGGLNLKRIFGKQAMSVFICPPSIEELDRRLHARGDTSEEMIRKRLAKASIEMEDAPLFDHIVVNNRLEQAKSDLDQLVSSLTIN